MYVTFSRLVLLFMHSNTILNDLIGLNSSSKYFVFVSLLSKNIDIKRFISQTFSCKANWSFCVDPELDVLDLVLFELELTLFNSSIL